MVKFLGIMSVATALSCASVAQEERKPSPLAFTPAGSGEFAFDTGVLRGKLRPGGKSRGLSSVVHVPTGVALDRGDKGYGLFSHYRVFSSGKRYGTGAWDWPGEGRLLEDGAVETRWPAAEDRPFEMTATYRWSAQSPGALDLRTRVKALKALPKFEVFLASYFTEAFNQSMAYVQDSQKASGQPGFMAAEKAAGDWQMFPSRRPDAVEVINDGRWKLPPHPVAWTVMPALDKALAVRRDAKSGLTVALMAAPDQCFAVAMPYQTEGHYSVYLSLFGRDLAEGETVHADARLVVGKDVSDEQVLKRHHEFVCELGPKR
jgi:hypothetical protein